ncbi:hypothetical protein D3C75_773480 [compost metagenome]
MCEDSLVRFAFAKAPRNHYMVKVRNQFRHSVKLLPLQRRTTVRQEQQLDFSLQLIQYLQCFFIYIRTAAAFCGKFGRQCFGKSFILHTQRSQSAAPGFLAVDRSQLLHLAEFKLFTGREISPQRFKRVDSNQLGERKCLIRFIEIPCFPTDCCFQLLRINGVSCCFTGIAECFFYAPFIPEQCVIKVKEYG